MKLEVLTPERTIYTGDVEGIQLPGLDGSFELLNNHAPLVAALGKGNMKIIINSHTQETYEIGGGFVQTANNKTSVLVEGVQIDEA